MSRYPLAIPISQLFRNECDRRKISSINAVYEYRDGSPKIKNNGMKCLYHSNESMSRRDFIKQVTKKGILEFLRKNDLEFACFDFGPACQKTEIVNWRYEPLSPIFSKEELFEICGENIRLFREQMSVPMAIENLNYYPTDAHRIVCDPLVIRELCNKFDLGLVLDIAHVLVSANYLKIPWKEYVSYLPLERVWELHFSHPQNNLQGQYVDAHELPAEGDYKILEEIAPMIVTEHCYICIEYYKDSKLLYESYSRVNRSLNLSNG